MWNNGYAKTPARERGDNGLFAAIAAGTTPAPEWKEVDVLADVDAGQANSFAQFCEEDQSLADDWSEYQANGMFAAGKGVGSLGVLSLVAHGAPIGTDGRDAAIRAACGSPNPVTQAAGMAAAERYWSEKS